MVLLVEYASVGLLALSVGLIIVGYFYVKNLYNHWESRGIKGPKPRLIFGNALDLFLGDRAEKERKWIKEYGSVYGVYQGTSPRLMIADPELMLQICVKDFDSFVNHEVNEFSNKYQKSFLFALKGDHWKKVRALTTPTFTSGKIKRMFKFLDGCAQDLIDSIKDEIQEGGANVGIDLKKVYNLFAMDAITTCCYGIKLQRKALSKVDDDPSSRDEFVDAAKNFSNFSMWRVLMAIIMPKWFLRSIGFTIRPEDSFAPLIQRASSIINQRRKSKKKFDDYLQLLLDAELNQQMDLNETDSHEDFHAGLTSQIVIDNQKKMIQQVESGLFNKNNLSTKNKVILSDLEIISGSIFLLSVGLDTTASLLSNTSYILAFHQEIQEKLYQELQLIAEFDVDDKTKPYFSYEAITSCKYLDAVLAESLRMFSPVITLDRKANEDYIFEKLNLKIAKGSVVNICFHAIMNDPKNWLEPRKFDPERFMPGKKELIKPGSYCPFGIGPRHCIGMRFSLTEAKLALARCLMSFKIEPAPGTTFPPESEIRFVLYNIKNSKVKLTQR